METYVRKFGTTTEYKLSTITPKHLNSNSNYNNTDSKKALKTPNKTPLHLNSAKKKTPSTLTNDRYIPNRTSSNMEASYHLMVSGRDQENIRNDQSLTDSIKRKLINDTCQGAANEKSKILNLHSKQPEPDQVFAENIKVLYNGSLITGSAKKNTIRQIQQTPEKILDAPEIVDDFYLNLIDWSSTNNLAVALKRDLYIWNATTKEISQLFAMDENSQDIICSVSWIQKGNILAVGNSKNMVELWDINKQTCLRQMKSHRARVSSLSWNQHVLSSGSRSGEIHNHDVRVAQHHVGTLKLHSQEVCGLKWSPDGRHLASGANDNLVAIWDTNNNSTGPNSNDSKPLHVLRDHTAAVKAIAWCPWQHNILATGGGSNDGKIRIWNAYNGNLLQCQDTKSQVSSLLWSKQHKEIISSHGFPLNQMTIWKYPDMQKVGELNGHTNRILLMSMSPDEEIVASAGADETLRLWKCFALDEKQKKAKESGLEKKSSSQTGLSRCIR